MRTWFDQNLTGRRKEQGLRSWDRFLLEEELLKKSGFIPRSVWRVDFSFYFDVEVHINEIDGKPALVGEDYNPLLVRIDCGYRFPEVLPKVYDLKKVLRGHPGPHYNRGDDSLCYAFLYSTGLDFKSKHSLVDLVAVIQSFLLKQYVYERKGEWPNSEPHGPDAFVAYEFDHGCISPDRPCGCSSGADYGACCLRKVETRINEIKPLLIKSVAKITHQSIEEVEKRWNQKNCEHGRDSVIHAKPYLTKELLMGFLNK